MLDLLYLKLNIWHNDLIFLFVFCFLFCFVLFCLWRAFKIILNVEHISHLVLISAFIVNFEYAITGWENSLFADHCLIGWDNFVKHIFIVYFTSYIKIFVNTNIRVLAIIVLYAIQKQI